MVEDTIITYVNTEYVNVVSEITREAARPYLYLGTLGLSSVSPGSFSLGMYFHIKEKMFDLQSASQICTSYNGCSSYVSIAVNHGLLLACCS